MRNLRHSLLALCVYALILLLAGCNPEDKSNLSKDAKEIAQHTSEAIGNADIAVRVKAVLAVRKGVDMSDLNVEAKDGVITLRGTVRNAEERKRVIETVNGIRGVDRVVADDLHVKP